MEYYDVGGFHNLKGLVVVLGSGFRVHLVDFHKMVVCLHVVVVFHSLHVVVAVFHSLHLVVVCLHDVVVCLHVVVVFHTLHLVVVCLHRED